MMFKQFMLPLVMLGLAHAPVIDGCSTPIDASMLAAHRHDPPVTWSHQQVLDDLERRRAETRTLARIRQVVIRSLRERGIDPGDVPGFDAWNLEVTRVCAAVQAQFINTRQFDRDGSPRDVVVIGCDPAGELRISRPGEAGRLVAMPSARCRAMIMAWAGRLESLTSHSIVETGELLARLAVQAH